MEHTHEHTHDHSLEGEPLGEVIQHILEHSLLDVLYLIPFLFVTYLLMECLEHKTGGKTQEAIRRAGAGGPVIGALLGALPQCGFSAAAATLYAGRVVTLGTVFAVFLATSDEMLPIFIAEQVPPLTILKILGAKVFIGMLMGFIVDAGLRIIQHDKNRLRIHELCEQDHCHCSEGCHTCEEEPESVYEHHDDCSHGCSHEHHHHDHDHDHGWTGILKSSLIHTVQVSFFILIITLVLNAVLAFVDEHTLEHFLAQDSLLAVVAASIVGLIPNCAASVVIAQLYLEGVLGTGAMMSGLLVSAGVGLLILIRANRPMKQNVKIIAALVVTGVFWGLVINALGITFM